MLSIVAKTNHPVPYINVLIIETKYGTKYVIDREHTEYSYDEETGVMTMDWHGTYIWDSYVNRPVSEGLLECASVIEIEIEDDAPEGYYFDVLEVTTADGIVLPVETNARRRKLNAEMFKDIFGCYVTEIWSMEAKEFEDWMEKEYVKPTE